MSSIGVPHWLAAGCTRLAALTACTQAAYTYMHHPAVQHSSHCISGVCFVHRLAAECTQPAALEAPTEERRQAASAKVTDCHTSQL